MLRKIYLAMVIILTIATIGCSKSNNVNSKVDDENNIKEVKTIKNGVNYSKDFDGINGCAVFYNKSENIYDLYNSQMCNEEVSPYSTFKIVSTLMGLSQDVINSKNSKMGYDGTIYWRDTWNYDLGLSDAFKESCVWYFENIVSQLDKDYVQGVLNNLEYGNKDISDWNENGHNSFWLSSSLKISPLNQIDVLSNIFEKTNNFDSEDIKLLKEIMLIEQNEDYSIYGKTGSAKDTNAWFVGFVEKNNQNTYFAIRLKDENVALGSSVAKEIGLSIIKKYYTN